MPHVILGLVLGDMGLPKFDVGLRLQPFFVEIDCIVQYHLTSKVQRPFFIKTHSKLPFLVQGAKEFENGIFYISNHRILQ